MGDETNSGQLVLVVEDDAGLRALLRRALRHAGFQVRACDDGSSALELLQEELPHVMVVDFMLPEMDGYTLMLEARSRLRQLTPRAILVSGIVDQLSAEELAPFEAHFMKPFKLDQIVSAVTRLAREPRIRHSSAVHRLDDEGELAETAMASGDDTASGGEL